MNCFGKYLLIRFVPQIGNEATLFCSKQVSGSTYIQILHSDMDATPQITEVLNRLQASFSFCRQTAQRRRQQIAESLFVTASYPSTHLMEVTQTKVLRLVDNDRIGIRNIDTALYDSSRQKHIIVIIDKVKNDLFQLCGFHLSMPDSNTAIGNMTFDHRFQFRKVRNPVVDKENLTVATHLKINRVRNHFLIEGMYFCLNRIAVRRRRRDYTQVAGSHQRELKRTWNRCGSHGQCIHIHL